MRKVFLFILLVFMFISVSAKKIAEFDDIYKLSRFKIDGNDLYVVDDYSIKLFSLKDAKLITQFGKKGEGPGEFRMKPSIQVFPDYIFVSDYGKILFFKRDGEYIREKRIPAEIDLAKVGSNYLARDFSFDAKERKSKFGVKVVDSELKKIKDMYSFARKLPRRNTSSKKKNIFDREMFAKRKRITTDGNFIYLYDTSKGFYIEICDHMGEKIRTITKKTELLKISKEFKKKYAENLEKNRKKNIGGISFGFNYIFPEYFPPIIYLSADNEKIYVTTYENDTDKRTLVILDHNGVIQKKISILTQKMSIIHKDKLYYFIDNEDEEVWELHVEDL